MSEEAHLKHTARLEWKPLGWWLIVSCNPKKKKKKRMVATEASGMWPVMACQRRHSQLTTVAVTGHSKNMWLMVCGWAGVQQANGQHACCGVALPI